MSEEAYVSFETAKLLKEKGFNGHCHVVHINNHNSIIGKVISNSELTTTHEYKFCKDQENCITIPTQQMACRWLREEKNIDIIPLHERLPRGCYWCRIEYNLLTVHQQFPIYSTYENAVEAALQYVLNNLI